MIIEGLTVRAWLVLKAAISTPPGFLSFPLSARFPPHPLLYSSLVVGDGQAAEDGQAPARVQAGGLGAAEAAGAERAAQVALPVGERVRGAGRRVEDGGLGEAAQGLEAEGGRGGRRRRAVPPRRLLLLAAVEGGGGRRGDGGAGGEAGAVDGERRDEAAQLLAREGEGVVGAGRREQLLAVGGGGGRRGGAGPAGALEQRRLQPRAGLLAAAVLVVGGEAGEAQAVVQLGPLAALGPEPAAAPQRWVAGDEGAQVSRAAGGVGRRVGVVVRGGGRGRAPSGRGAALVRVVDEVAARAVGAEADGVEGAAQLGLVLGVARQAAQLVEAVRELALLAVFAGAALLEGPAQLGLVARRVDGRPAAPLARLLLQLLHEVLAALAILAERAVPELVLLV